MKIHHLITLLQERDPQQEVAIGYYVPDSYGHRFIDVVSNIVLNQRE